MIFSVEGPIATIRLNRPAEHNRIEPADLDELIAHVSAVNSDHAIHVLIFASTGKTFSSGFHLGAIGAGAPLRFQEAADALASCRVPTIAAIQGNVYGGAADLALACDFRIGAEHIHVMVPAAMLGIPYYPSAIERFIQRVAPGTVKRILLLCEKISARELLESGYLDEIVGADQIERRVAELATHLTVMAPMAVQAIKAQLNRFDRAVAEEAVRECLRSEEHRRRLADFK
jgi:enoyl-CoA hydratase/carnithine racemase